MTYREFLTGIATGKFMENGQTFDTVLGDELRDEFKQYAQRELDKLDSYKDKRKAAGEKERAEKQAEADQAYALMETGKTYTSSELAAYLGVSTSKVTAMMKLVEVTVGEGINGKRVVKTYTK